MVGAAASVVVGWVASTVRLGGATRGVASAGSDGFPKSDRDHIFGECARVCSQPGQVSTSQLAHCAMPLRSFLDW